MAVDAPSAATAVAPAITLSALLMTETILAPRSGDTELVVGERHVVAARLAAKARAGGEVGRRIVAGGDGQEPARGHRLRVRQRHVRGAGGLGLVECPYGLVAAGGRDGHADPRSGPVHVALVIEGHDDLRPLPAGQRSGVALSEAKNGLELGALGLVELALARPQPAALDVGLLVVGPHLGNGDLEVHARRRGLDPRLQRTRTDHGGVLCERRAHVGDRVRVRALGPVVRGRRGPEVAGAGVAGEVGPRTGRGVPGEPFAARGATAIATLQL